MEVEAAAVTESIQVVAVPEVEDGLVVYQVEAVAWDKGMLVGHHWAQMLAAVAEERQLLVPLGVATMA